jgi:hypothetical protein
MENQDLYDLCVLNKMEEADPPEDLQKAIDWKKDRLVNRLKHNRPKIDEKVLEDHIKRNTVDGVYPPGWAE